MKRALYIQRPETKELPVLSAEVAFQRLISALEAYGTVDELNSHRMAAHLSAGGVRPGFYLEYST